jgi:hypothetical protein
MADELELPVAEQETAAEEAAEEDLGVYSLDDADLVKKLAEWLKESADHGKTARKRRKLDWKMYNGDSQNNGQWDEGDVRVYDGQKRPRLTQNMILTIVAAVAGEERTNRQEMKFYGNEESDDGTAHGLNGILKWIMQSCMGEFALSAQFLSDVVAGEGWVVPTIDFFDDPEGLIKVEHVDEDEVYDDPLCKCPVSSDSRRMARTKLLSNDEIFGRWQEKKNEITMGSMALGIGIAGAETDNMGAKDIYLTPGDVSSMKLYDAKRKMYAVVESWWWQIEDGVVVVDELTGMLVEKSPEEYAEMKAQREMEQQAAFQQALTAAAIQPSLMDTTSLAGMPQMPAVNPMAMIPPPIQASERKVKCFYQAYWMNGILLEKRKAPLKELKRFPYVPARAIWDKGEAEWKGLVRFIIDSQKQHNVEQSSIVQLIQLMPKSSWMAPKGAFHNKEEWKTKLAVPGAMLEYNGSKGKPEPIKQPDLPRHLIDMAMTRPQAMREISGVNVDMMGQRVGNDPMVAMEMRQKAAKTVLAPIFDNYRMTKIALGKVLLAFIQSYIKPGRKVRVLGPEGTSYAQMTDQEQIGKYDVTVEETNATVNDRIATLNILQTTLPQMMKAGIGITPSFIDLMPMPPHVRDDWKRQISWEMTIAGKIPPEWWQPGMGIPAIDPITGQPMPPMMPPAAMAQPQG